MGVSHWLTSFSSVWTRVIDKQPSQFLKSPGGSIFPEPHQQPLLGPTDLVFLSPVKWRQGKNKRILYWCFLFFFFSTEWANGSFVSLLLGEQKGVTNKTRSLSATAHSRDGGMNPSEGGTPNTQKWNRTQYPSQGWVPGVETYAYCGFSHNTTPPHGLEKNPALVKLASEP